MLSLVADYGRFNFQTVINFMRATNVEFTTTSAIKFNTCYALSVYPAFDWNVPTSPQLGHICFEGVQWSHHQPDSPFFDLQHSGLLQLKISM